MHVALIMDGNRRWAKQKNLASQKGHIQGIKQLEEIIRCSYDTDIQVLTLYCFSTENWKRTTQEVSYLMDLFAEYIVKYQKKFEEYDISFRHIGRKDRIPNKLAKAIQTVEANTKNKSQLTLQFAIDYGARDEMMRACNRAVASQKVLDTEEDLAMLLDTKDHSHVDLVIRTSGEERLSNFLLWQAAYSEFIFRDEYFPDFTKESFVECIEQYKQRKRRMGG